MPKALLHGRIMDTTNVTNLSLQLHVDMIC